MWMISIGSAPLFVAFWSMIGASGSDSIAYFTQLFLMLRIESCAFLARACWFGPGRASVRIPLIILMTASAALQPGWIEPLADAYGIENESTRDLLVGQAVMTLAALAISGLFAGRGSRDIARTGVRPRVGTADLCAIASASALLVAMAFPHAMGWVSVERGLGYRFQFAEEVVRPAVGASVVFVCMLAWRLGVRGIERWRSWRTLLLGVGILPWTLILALMIVGVLTDQTRPPVALGFAIAFGIVPIAREIFFRVAGYRAINLYAERRTTKEALGSPTS